MINCPTVAVLLAAYNGKEFISEQVDSIFNQTGVEIQLYISVDLSTDGTYEWCKQLETGYHNVTVLGYGEKFGGAAKNFFRLIKEVDFSSFDYVALSDQDDIWLPNKLTHAVKLILIKKLDGFSSDVVAFWKDGRERLVKKSYHQKKFDYIFESGGAGCTYVLKSDALGVFRKHLLSNWEQIVSTASGQHDWLIYAFFRSKRFRWLIDDKPLMRYRQHDSNQVGFNSGFKAYLKRISMVRNNWYRVEVEKIMALYASSDHVTFSLNHWFLVRHIWQLRRRPRDVFALFIMIVIGFF
jgi:rhamnosyltransferase